MAHFDPMQALQPAFVALTATSAEDGVKRMMQAQRVLFSRLAKVRDEIDLRIRTLALSKKKPKEFWLWYVISNKALMLHNTFTRSLLQP